MPASFLTVLIDGEPLDQFSQNAILEQVDVRQELNQHWWCMLECRQTEDRRFPIEDSIGKDLQVAAVDEKGVERVIFDGFVLKAELEYEIYGSYTARLTAVTGSYLLDLTPRQTYYLQKSLGDVAENLAGLAGLKVDLQYKPKDPPLSYTQWDETDFDFLKRLADDHDCWIRPARGGLEIFNKFQDGSTLQWRGEEGLRSFKVQGELARPSMNGSHYQFSAMKSKIFAEVRGEADFFEGSGRMVAAVKEASKNKFPPGYISQRARAVTLDDYEKRLTKESIRSIGSKIVGHGVSRNEELMPGNTVRIEGVLDASGQYGLTKVLHHWTPKGYMNEFWCTPWRNYTNPDPPRMKQWSGVVPARVVANDDPEHMGRVQVRFYWQGEGQTIWTRTMTPHAGSDRGFYFIPEIGDEVVVAFTDGDPERPVILGSLWNGVDKAPTEEFWGGEYAKNDVKRIVTKSGHRIQIVDKEGKESISIATPNHLRISLIEKTDETNRSMITLHSENGDIFLSAPSGRIHFHSKYFSREVGDGGKVEKARSLPMFDRAAAQQHSVLPKPPGSPPAVAAPIERSSFDVFRSAEPVVLRMCTVKEMKSKLLSCDAGTGQWTKATKAIGKEPVIQVAPVKDFEAATDPLTGTITVAPTPDCCGATSSLFFELDNVRNIPEFIKVDGKAAKGELGREEYVKLNEKIEYEGVIRLRDTFPKCKESWGCGPRATSGYESVSDDFDAYYEQVVERHKNHYRNHWDKFYKAAYEAEQKKASR